MFGHPLTNVPHSLSSFDGTPNSNSGKADILALFVEKNENETRQLSFPVEIIDGFLLLTSLGEAPTKYGKMANFLLRKICSTAALEIHVLFEKYQPRNQIRNEESYKKSKLYDDPKAIYKINGPNQERTCSLVKCLNSSNFRDELVQFLMTHWENDDHIVPGILNNK